MTRTPDDTKKGLECCAASYADCHKECPYKLDCDGSQILKDALALIQQYEKTIDNLAEANAAVHKKCDSLRLRVENREESLRHLNNLRDAAAGRALEMEERVHQLEAERDAAVESMRSDPHCCYHCVNMTKRGICQSEPRADGHCFEWRGVQKEE